MTDLILKTGKVQTRDGREVRIYATDAGGSYPVHGAVRCGLKWEFKSWLLTGVYSSVADLKAEDLVPIPQPQYFNIHTGPDGRSRTDPMCGSIDGIKDQAFKYSRRNWSCETFKYLSGVVTKIEPEEHE